MLSVAAGVILFLVLVLLLVRYSLPALPNYLQQVEVFLSSSLGAKVDIDTLHARWHGWKLALDAQGVEVHDPTAGVSRMRIDHAILEISLPSLLRDPQQPRIRSLYLRGAEIHYHSDGMAATPDVGNALEIFNQLPQELHLHDGRIRYSRGAEMEATLIIPRLWIGPGRKHSRKLRAAVELQGGQHRPLALELGWQGSTPDTMTVRFAGKKLHASRWLHALDIPLPAELPRIGEAPADILGALHWKHGKLSDARLHISGDLQLISAEVPGNSVFLPSSRLLLTATETPEGMLFLGGYLRTATLSADNTSPGNEFRLLVPPQEHPRLRMDHFDLGQLKGLLPLFTDIITPAELPHVFGLVQSAELALGGDYPGWLKFADVELLRPMGALESLHGLSGRLEFDISQGHAELQAARLQASPFPSHDSDPGIGLSELEGRVYWHREAGGGALLNIEGLRAIPADAAEALLTGNIRWPRQGPPDNLDLALRLTEIDHSTLYALLPVEVREQAAAKIPSAAFPSLEIKWNGPPDFSSIGNADGPQLSAEAEFIHAMYVPGKNLPSLTGIRGRLQLHRQTLELSLAEADWNELRLTDAQLKIPDFGAADRLDFSFGLSGDAEALRQLSSHWIPRMQPPWQLQGNTVLQLQGEVHIPAEDPAKLHSLQGTLRLENVDASHAEMHIAFSALEGVVQLGLDGFSSAELSGRYQGSPMLLDVQYTDTLLIHAELQTSAQAVKHELALRVPDLPEPLERIGQSIHGSTHWKGTIVQQAPHMWALDFHSDLHGLALELPDPLGKEAAEQSPFSWAAVLQSQSTRIEMQYRDLRLSSVIPDDDTPATQHWQGKIPRISVEEWYAWMGTQHNKTTPWTPHGLDVTLEIDTLSWHGRDYALYIKAESHPQMWQAELDGTDIQGLVRIPYSNDPLWDIFLEHLVYTSPNRTADTTNLQTLQPDTLPQMRINIEELILEQDLERIWKVQSTIQRTADRNLSGDITASSGEDLLLTGTGTWRHTESGADVSSIALELKVDELSDFFRAVDEESDGITGAPGTLSLTATWPDTPDAFALTELEGTLQLDFGAGTLQEISTGGAWVLGLFSLQTPMNILTLNPLKSFQKGLAFERLYGEFDIRDGHAYTQGFKLEGDALDITLTGRSGLIARDYEQEVTVLPNLYSSLALPGIIFGPIGIGAGYAITTVLGHAISGLPEKINQIARKRYRITGTWSDPLVEPLQEKPEPAPTE